MATRAMAQDVIICDMCETSPVEMCCNSCTTNLCKGCVNDHISADTEKDHNIVIYKKKNTKPIFPKCKLHKEQNCEMKCQQCDTLVCVQCIDSQFHEQHKFSDLLKLCNSYKDIIKHKTTKLETLTYPKYEEAISDLQIQIQNLPQTYDRLISEISDQGEEWHREVDIITSQRKQEAEKMKTDDLATLNKLLGEMKNLLTALRQAIKENIDIIQSADVTKVLDSKYTSPEMWDPPPAFDATPPKFAPLPIQGKQLRQMFGTLTAASMPRSLSYMKLVEGKLATAVKQFQLLDSPTSPSSIHTGYDRQYSIACLTPDEVWVCGYDSQIKCFTDTGSLQQTITTNTRNSPSGLTVSRHGDLIYTDQSDKSINRFRHGKIEKIISLLQEGWSPMAVCCTDSDELLIIMQKYSECRVVRYSESTEKQVIQFDDRKKPLFSLGTHFFIAQNSKKGVICVSDAGFKRVLFFNQTGKLCFIYKGNLFSQKYSSFSPRGVVIDSIGHILVADYDNKCIHIMGQQGRFIRYIDNCQLSGPWDLSLDRNNTLYVAEFVTAKLKIIKYLKETQTNTCTVF